MSRDHLLHVDPADRPFERIGREPPEDGTDVVPLGMPHLDGDGLSLVWLLKDCAHRQWWSIADPTGLRPSALRDRSGVRAMALVVAGAVRGAPEGFREDDLVVVDRKVAPRPETGWRGCWRLVASSGAAMTVEHVTVFARRGGASNIALAPADMPLRVKAERMSASAWRAAALLDRGRAAMAAPPPAPRGRAFLQVFVPAHFNAMGLKCFANVLEPIERAERTALPPHRQGGRLAAREVHNFGIIDDGDVLDVDYAVGEVGIGPDAALTLASTVHRRSDSAVIAICLSNRGAAGPCAAGPATSATLTECLAP